MDKFWKGAAASLLVCGLATVAWNSVAQAADPPRQAVCATFGGVSQKTIGNKYEAQMNAWLSEGKTHFVQHPFGLCAW